MLSLSDSLSLPYLQENYIGDPQPIYGFEERYNFGFVITNWIKIILKPWYQIVVELKRAELISWLIWISAQPSTTSFQQKPTNDPARLRVFFTLWWQRFTYFHDNKGDGGSNAMSWSWCWWQWWWWNWGRWCPREEVSRWWSRDESVKPTLTDVPIVKFIKMIFSMIFSMIFFFDGEC